ncbi:MAG: NADH-quinone oxidoreductase subunit L [Aigarchaeota archaeon]|nr:NADH-quinone oxidoreductase subunit L [Candidatus Wolframiiraptor gerlachensis]
MSIEPWAFYAWACWIIPVIGALSTPLLNRISERVRDLGAVIFSLLAMLMTLGLLPLLFSDVEWPLRSQVSWVLLPGAPILSEIRAGMLLDPLSIIMANVVSVVSFLIMVYSAGYMRGDPGLTRYWFFMNFFIANMLLLVLADNLVLMLIGWEGVGLCSYALIGYWYRDSKEGWLHYWVGEPPEAYPPSHCGMKAFIVTRFGDLFMIAGVLMLAATVKTISFPELLHADATAPMEMRWLLPVSLVMILGGAVGKSAQLPLMEWLPDAMAGPSSVSALIHAATMVKAGVYLVARLFPIALNWSASMPAATSFFYAVMWIGALTAFIAASQAVASTELKKVLAYSTVSQIGYMMMALGAAGLSAEILTGYVASIFHLMNHAVFKAALFLAAGSIIHAAGSRFLRDMGGLRKYMPVTFYSTLLATFALIGLPPFGGFWSKDLVLSATLSSGQYAVFILGLVTAILTAFYSIRMIGLAFCGGEESRKAHEAPRIMWIPYLILAALSLIIGLVAPLLESGLETALSRILPVHAHPAHGASSMELLVPLASVIAIAVGAVPAYALYVRRIRNPEEIIEKHGYMKALRMLLIRRYYINAFYYRAIAYPSIRLSHAIHKAFELRIIEGINKAISIGARRFSDIVRRVHTGLLNHYVIGLILGALILIILILAGGA